MRGFCNGRSHRVIGLMIVACTAAGVLEARAGTVFVKPGGADTNDGLTWGTAKKTVAAGLAVAVAGDQVWVAAGTYVERITLKNGVGLYGGFTGNEIQLAQRNWVNHVTILDGSGTASGAVVTASSGFTASTRIDGFTICKGPGNGILCSSSSPTIVNNIITGNSGASFGGGISGANSSAVISNNTITGNAAGTSGGGIYWEYGSPTIVNNIIAGNSAKSYGGGIYGYSDPPAAILNNTIVGNSAGTSGGGIYWASGSPAISNNIVAFNSTGILKSGGTPALSNNCVYNPDGTNYSGLSPGTGDVSVDPQLVTVEFGQVHLGAGSPCIDAGLDGAAQAGAVDLDGEARVQGLHVDIGADEFNGTAPPFAPAIIRVSLSGDDAHDGSSWALAKRTVQGGIDAASLLNGAEVWVAAGIYNERIILKAWTHAYGGFMGTELRRDERNWQAHATILDGGGSGSVVTVQAGQRVSRIDGFVIRNGGGTNSGWGVACLTSSPVVANNLITMNSGGGVVCNYGASPIISANQIRGNNSTGISCSFNSAATMVNNAIVGNSQGVYCYLSSPAITNNTIAGNNRGINSVSSSPIIKNNIVALGGSGISSPLDGAPVLLSNCIYNPGGTNYSGVNPGGGDISLDPQLLAADYGDYHLRAESPCIDAGTDAMGSAGWTDIDGEQRIQSAHVDIGADEFNGTTPALAPPVIVRVSPTGDDASDGSSWAAAKRTVQAGIETAASAGHGDVWVSAGTFNERVLLRSWVYVYGGFAGTEGSRDERNWNSNITVLDGGWGGSVVSVFRGFRINSMDGFTICHGTGVTSGGSSGGGGIYCYDSSPLIMHNQIVENRATATGSGSAYGGGIYCLYCSPVISGNTIAGNRANSTGTGSSFGGGIYGPSSYAEITKPLITNNVIMNNTVSSSSTASSYGGGIYATGTIANNVIVGNTATTANIGSNYGGGVYCDANTAVVAGNTIVANVAATGGAVYCSNSNAAISNNLAAYNSTGFAGSGGAPTLRYNCVYSLNKADYSGISPGLGDFSADPQLLAVGYGKVHLAAGSPCIDAGYDAAVQPAALDMDGEPRIQGAHVDIGADEFNGTAPPPFVPAILRVSPAGDDANDGSSWVSAKLTVQAGIDAVASVGGGEVWVSAGTYNQRVVLKPWTYLYGGFEGTENSREQRDWRSHVATLDGGSGGSVISIPAGCSLCGVDGFTIRRGSGTGSGSSRRGGGVYSLSSLPILTNNLITSNMGDYAGGGIYCASSAFMISNNTITANGAMYGGAIFCSYASPLIVNNTMKANGAGGGGAVCCDHGSPTITNNTIVANSAGTGGGIYCATATPAISNNILAFNASGIYSSGVTPTLRGNCVYNPGGYDYSGVSAGVGDISADPKLVAPAYGSTHLMAGSPCIDAGQDSAVQAGWVDMDGQVRIQAAHVDIGADEYDGTAPLPFEPSVVLVSPSGNDANDGLSWASAKRTVQAGIDAALGLEGEVWVANGVYDEQITLTPWAYVYGGFAGTETSRDQRDWARMVTILDGGSKGSVVSAVGGHRVSCVDGFTIRNGTGTVSSSDRVGGGVYCRLGSPIISNDTIRGNTASYGGGLYCSTPTTILNSVIAGNTAGSYGGGLFSVSSMIVTQCKFSGNTAGTAGGGLYSGSSLTMTQCTLSGNTAPSGAGLYNYGNLVLTNSISWGNSGPAVTNSSGTLTATYCDVQGGYLGTGNTNSDPKFVRGASAGGDGVWGTEDDDYGDLRLLAGSPCIDAGLNSAVPAGVTVDLDGHGRFYDDPASADCAAAPGSCGTGPIVDIGAYEYIAGDFDRDGDLDAADVAGFAACLSGPSVMYAGDCLKADLDRDGDVDLADYGVLQRCYSGAGKVVDPGCVK